MHDPNELPPLADEIEAFLTEQGVNDETRYMARKYYPTMWGKASQYSDHRHPISTWPGLWNHVREAEKDVSKSARIEDLQSRVAARKARTAKSELGTEWLAWQEQCTQRNRWIEQANAEWRTRVAAMNKAMLEWKVHVEAARLEYQTRKATPAPVQPKR